MYRYEHIKSPENVEPGLRDTMLLAPMPWLSVVKEPISDGESLESVVITEPGNHLFKEDYGFIEVLLAPGKQSLFSNTVGEAGGGIFEHELTAKVIGSYSRLHAAMSKWKDMPLLVLFKDITCSGTWWYQLGVKGKPAYLKHVFNTGDNKNNREKGYTATFTAVYDSVIMHKGIPRLIGSAPLDIITEDGIPIVTETGEHITI